MQYNIDIYAVGIDAKTIIWISPNPRVEHVEVIEWLNEVTPVDMSWYILKIEVVKIDDSPIAPLFSIVAGPSQERKATEEIKKDVAERHLKRIQFWEGFLPVLNDKTNLLKDGPMWLDNRRFKSLPCPCRMGAGGASQKCGKQSVPMPHKNVANKASPCHKVIMVGI